MSHRTFLRAAVIGSALLGTGPSLAANEIPFPQDIRLALPKQSGMTAEWVIPPAADSVSMPADTTFDVDGQGNIWLRMNHRILFDPASGVMFRINAPVTSHARLDSDVYIVGTDSNLGFVHQAKTAERGMPLLEYHPVLKFPFPRMRLFPGVGDVLFLVGENPGTGKHELYTVRQGGGKGVVEKLFEDGEDITAVAGTAEEVYVALGPLIVELLPAEGRVERVFRHPEGKAITQLCFRKDTGLFFAVEDAVGFIGSSVKCEFIKASGTQILLRGNALYVLFEKQSSVLKVANVDGFATVYHPPGKPETAASPATTGGETTAVGRQFRFRQTIPPLAEARQAAAGWRRPQLLLSTEGEPWLFVSGTTLIAPRAGLLGKSDRYIRQVVFRKDGVMVATTDTDWGELGRVPSNPRAADLPVVFRRMATLPCQEARMATGTAGDLFFYGTHADGGFSLWMLKSTSGNNHEYFPVLRIQDPIGAVTADSAHVYAAVGDVIHRISLKDLAAGPEEWLRAPTQITTLAADGLGGVFFATATHVGHGTSRGLAILLESPRPQLAWDGRSLHILRDNLEVITLENAMEPSIESSPQSDR